MNIEDYRCTSKYTKVVHIAFKILKTRTTVYVNTLCDNKEEMSFYDLSEVHKRNPVRFIEVLYRKFCPLCFEKLPDKVKKEVTCNFIVAKLKG